MKIYQQLFALLILCILVGCKSTEKPARMTSSPDNIRVMSFNIRYNNPNDEEHAWPNRTQRVVSTILFNQTDLVGVQEALHEQIKDLQKALPEYNYIGVGRDDGKKEGEYAAIFYNKNRFELLDSGTFWLSTTPDVPGSKDWDAAITRVATWGKFKDKASGTTFFHYNTHFDHRGRLAREKSAELIAKRATEAAGNLPLVVTGDFNFLESTNGYKAMTRELKDGFYHSASPHHGPKYTFYGFEVTHKAGRRIDYIFVNNHFNVLQHAILSDNWEGAFASDHLPVVVTLTAQ